MDVSPVPSAGHGEREGAGPPIGAPTARSVKPGWAPQSRPRQAAFPYRRRLTQTARATPTAASPMPI
jgi:hypothetical protein